VLVLVVVLVFGVVGFCGEKGIRFPPMMILFNRSDGETSAFSGTGTSRSTSTSPRLRDLH
jgi:hypothetical protein